MAKKFRIAERPRDSYTPLPLSRSLSAWLVSKREFRRVPEFVMPVPPQTDESASGVRTRDSLPPTARER